MATELILSLIDFEEKDLEQMRLVAGERKLLTRKDFDGEIPPEIWEQAVVILGNPTPAQLKECTSLKLLQLQSAGADNYCKPGVLPENVALCNATGSYGVAIAEYMVGVTLMMAKNLHLYRDQQFAGVWRDLGPVMPIQGSKVLVLGLGDIGTEYALRMYTLGADIIGVTRTRKEGPPFVQKMAVTSELDELLPEADIVALSLPGGDGTKGILNENRLGLMKEDALLLNVGRGTAIDTEALTRALAAGHLRGAALDVTDPEPLPAGHPLWHEPRAVITPHISGGFHMRDVYEKLVVRCIRNLAAFNQGRPLESMVDRSTGYTVSH